MRNLPQMVAPLLLPLVMAGQEGCATHRMDPATLADMQVDKAFSRYLDPVAQEVDPAAREKKVEESQIMMVTSVMAQDIAEECGLQQTRTNPSLTQRGTAEIQFGTTPAELMKAMDCMRKRIEDSVFSGKSNYMCLHEFTIPDPQASTATVSVECGKTRQFTEPLFPTPLF